MKSRRPISFRAWLAGWAQARRRSRVQPPPAEPPAPDAPEIIFGDGVWEGTTAGWWDVFIDFEFDPGAWPVAQLELWLSRDNGPFLLLTAVNSADTSYAYPAVSDTEVVLDFKLRYRNGATLGPFSNVWRIDLQF